MTTIACDGKSMAGDGRSTCGDVIVENDQTKVFKTSDGGIVGLAGNTYNFEDIVAHYTSDDELPWPTINGDITILLLKSDGTVYTVDRYGRELYRSDPLVAIGTGWQFAMTALRCGKSPEEAVKIASELDVFTGGKITSLSLSA